MQRTFWDEIVFQFRSGKMVTRLILINVFIFLAIQIYILILFLTNNGNEIGIYHLSRLIAPNGDVVDTIVRPWSIILYMFTHIQVRHILFNMLFFYFSGKIFEEYLGEKRLLNTYLFGGLAGLLLYMIAWNVFPVFHGKYLPIVGASASVMAVFSSLAFWAPSMEVALFGVIRMRLIVMAGIFILIDLISIPKGNAGGHIAHLGGVIFGAYAAQAFKNPKNFLTAWDITRVFKPSTWNGSKPKMKVYKNKRSVSDDDYNALKADRQKRIDAILDKISKSGYESLTKEEKDFLFNHGKDV